MCWPVLNLTSGPGSCDVSFWIGASQQLAPIFCKHIPVIPYISVHRDHFHDLVTKLVGHLALKWLGEVIGNHVFGGAILNCNVLAGNPVSDEGNIGY